MSTFFASDIHFGHDNLRKYYPDTRGQFSSVERLDHQIISNWNDAIKHGDTVYVLGDLGDETRYLSKCLSELNGDKILITGNHDAKTWRQVQHLFVEVHQAYHEAWINKQFIVMCHYPIWEWNAISRGAWHLHGHLHGRPHGVPGKILDVGIDNHELKPFSYDDVSRFMNTREVRKHNV